MMWRCLRDTLQIQVFFKAVSSASTGSAVQRVVHPRRKFSTPLKRLDNRFDLTFISPTTIQPYSLGVCKIFSRRLMDVGDQQGEIARVDCRGVVNSSPVDSDYVACHSQQLAAGDTSSPQRDVVSDDCEKVLPQYPSSHQEGDGEGADPYSRKGYTSEVFKIEIENLPQWSGYKVHVHCTSIYTLGHYQSQH